LNSWVKYDEEGIWILKIVIGGAFYRKYMKSEYKNESELKRYVNSNLFEGNAKWCLIYNKVPDYVKEEHIKKLIHRKVNKNVEKVLISYDKPIVMLEEEKDESKLINLLKQCFLIYKTSQGYNWGKNLSGGYWRDYEHEFAKAGYNQSD